ncbi:unnamed protein product [Nezara viridula]|uniref:Uncharacterized protein n=1 Tax=Nezara viridula TaxID=85310 RepID=A0A9P0E4Z1_NEZVI|nr:unnamed protein product [Nezara viridula]
MKYPIPIAVPQSKISRTSRRAHMEASQHSRFHNEISYLYYNTTEQDQSYFPEDHTWRPPNRAVATAVLSSRCCMACVLVFSFYIQHYFSIHHCSNYFDVSSMDFIMKYPIPIAVPQSKISRTSQKGTHGGVATFPVPQQYYPLVAAWYRPMLWSSPFVSTSTLASSIALIESNV